MSYPRFEYYDLRNCTTQRQKQEEEKLKKNDQKYKVVSSQEIK